MEIIWFALLLWGLVNAWWWKHSRLFLHGAVKSEGITQKPRAGTPPTTMFWTGKQEVTHGHRLMQATVTAGVHVLFFLGGGRGWTMLNSSLACKISIIHSNFFVHVQPASKIPSDSSAALRIWLLTLMLLRHINIYLAALADSCRRGRPH